MLHMILQLLDEVRARHTLVFILQYDGCLDYHTADWVWHTGTFDYVTYLAKKAMIKKIEEHHPDPRYRALEEEMLEKVNATGIGPAGFGGKTTALALHVETCPTHIAGLPCAVAICCHVSRHQEVTL